MLKMIVSGGQTGADRAAWDAALELGLAIGGWVPKGWIAEDGRIPERYTGTCEADSPDPAVRTSLNVRDSDATVIVSRGPLTGGSLRTQREAQRLGRPVLHLDLSALAFDDAAAQLRDWLRALDPTTLNVAGPRQSSDPRIGPAVAALLRAALAR
jgi:hypothetical protein